MSRADVGVTKVARVYLDKPGGNLHVFGYNKDGEVDFNESRATQSRIRDYANSVDVSDFDIYQDLGYPFPTGKKSGETLTIKRNPAGEIVSTEGIAVDDTLKMVYEMAEKAYKKQ